MTQPVEVAETVWRACHEDKLHWYIPEDLRNFHVQIDRVLDATSSGGAAVNTCAVQSALPSMGFGGSGMSGMGRHHGIEGFREFSNPRGIVERGAEGDMIDAFYAPYAKAGAIADALFAPQK